MEMMTLYSSVYSNRILLGLQKRASRLFLPMAKKMVIFKKEGKIAKAVCQNSSFLSKSHHIHTLC